MRNHVSSIRGSELGKALQRGVTLPSSWYTDPGILDREKRRIFARCWHYVGPVSQVERPGEFFTCLLGDTPIVVVRDEEGELRAFINVCRHRASEVAQGSGCVKVLRCPYHGWTYGLDGALRSAPRSDRETDFDPTRWPLLAARVAVWGPLVFVNPDIDAAPFETTFAPLLTLDLGGHDLAAMRFHSRVEWQVEANWKVLSENYLECYHCPVSHPAFTRMLKIDPSSYVSRREGQLFLSHTPLRASALAVPPEGDRRKLPYDPRGGVDSAAFLLLWPHTTINLMPGAPNMYVLGFTPVDAERSRGFKDYLVGPGVDERRFQEMRDYFTLLGMEDKDLVEAVQRGLRSGVVPHGQLMLNSEPLVQQFQAFVYNALVDKGEAPEESPADEGRQPS